MAETLTREDLERHAAEERTIAREITERLVRVEGGMGELTESSRVTATGITSLVELTRLRAERDAEDREAARKEAAESAGWWRKQWEKWGPIGVLILVAVMAPQILPTVIRAMALAPPAVNLEMGAPSPAPAEP